MAVPKRRHSKARRDKKRTHKKLKVQGLARCSHCNRLKEPHKVCPHCGYYKGKEVIRIKSKKEKEEAK